MPVSPIVPAPRSRKLVLVHITQKALLALEKINNQKLIEGEHYDIMDDGWIRTEFNQQTIERIGRVKLGHEQLSDCIIRMAETIFGESNR